MTAVPRNPRVSELRELLRWLAEFRAVYETTGLEEIVTPEGNTWSLWDLEYLVEQTSRLTRRQRQAIILCLVHNMRERDAAVRMGVSETNPVMMYASLGLQRLLDMMDAGELERFNERAVPDIRERVLQRAHTIQALANEIKARITVVGNNCWLYPNPGAMPPRLPVRSPSNYLGYTTFHPMAIMYMVHIGPIPQGCFVDHTSRIPPASLACSNPDHGDLIVSPERKAKVQEMAARYTQSLKGVSA